MAYLSISERSRCVVFLAACVAASSYGLTAVGIFQFPHAETLPFPYPLTTTLFQLICTSTFLLCAGWFARPTSNALSTINGAAIYRILLLAVIFAAEAAVGNYVLYSMPFEAYLLSRALVLPLLLLFNRYIYASVSEGRVMLPSIALSIITFIMAFRSDIPHSWRMILVGILSSGLSALWLLQVQSRIHAAKPLSKGEYTVVNTSESISKRGGMETYTTWSLLCYTSLLSTIGLLPVVLYSDEPGHILRNCYFLTESLFWLYMLAGAAFRLVLFTSIILLVGNTSASTAAFFCVLVNATQILFFTFGVLQPLQLMGLNGALLSSMWFFISSTDFDPAWKSSWNRMPLFFRRNWYYASIPLAAMIGVGSLLQILLMQGSRGLVDTSPPLDRDEHRDFPATLYTSMVQGTDAYLGDRPPDNRVINLQLLMKECGAMQDPNTKDVFRCLEYLATKQEEYLITPIEQSQARSENEGDTEISAESAATDELEAPSKSCNGPIIPYHIWWSGPPTWRTELFIKAYLYTQNLRCSRLWIWINSEHQRNVTGRWLLDHRFKRFLPLTESGDIVLNEWKLPSRVPLPSENNFDELDKARYYRNPGRPNTRGERLVADSVIRDSSGQEWLQFYNDASQITYYDKALSNVARFTIIHLHGGIYLDAGTILLRDIRPLLLTNIAFIEKPDPLEPYGNAIIALPANSSISSYILRGGTRMGLLFHEAVLQRMFIQEGRDGNNYNGGLVRLEDGILDPIWAETHGQREGRCTVPCLNSYASVFKSAPIPNEWQSFDGESFGGATYNRTLESFYRGAFAYHIHGQKKTQYERGSWMDVICSAHDRFFAGERTNPYGEKWTGRFIDHYRHSK